MIVLVPKGDMPTLTLKIGQLFKRYGSKPPLHTDQKEQVPHRSRAEHIPTRELRHDREPRIDRVEGGSGQQ